MSRLSRIYRSRGHGIHSPFAFRFVTEVIGNRYRYYAYDEIEPRAKACHASRRELSLARLLHRVAVDVNPATAAVDDDVDELFRLALSLSDSRLKLRPISAEGDDAELIVVNSDAPADLPGDGKRRVVVYLNGDIVSTRGMSFSNGHTTIEVIDPKLPVDHFNLSF